MAISTKAKRSGLMERQKESIAGWLFISPWIIGFVVFTLGPLLYAIVLSFFQWDFIQDPRFIGLRNFERMFGDKLFWQSLKVTVTYGIMRVPMGILVGIGAAVLLNQRVKLLGLWRVLYYLPVILPPVATTLMWMWIYNPRYGVINNFLWQVFHIQGPAWLQDETLVLPSFMLMAVWGAMGRNMLIYLSGLQGISRELYDAADVDGAKPLSKFFYITLPMLSPVIFFNLITGMIDVFHLFSQPYVMTEGGPRNASLFFYYYMFRYISARFQVGYAAAMSLFVFILIMILTVLVFRSSSAWVYYEGEVKRGTE